MGYSPFVHKKEAFEVGLKGQLLSLLLQQALV
jgi:hypothetical protein